MVSTMTPASWSAAADLMSRTVCNACEHMHRRALRNACPCCGDDAAEHARDAES